MLLFYDSKHVANKAGLQQKDVLEILELTNTSSTLMLEKGNGEYIFHFILTILILTIVFSGRQGLVYSFIQLLEQLYGVC